MVSTSGLGTAGFRQSPTGIEKDPSPTALRSPLSP